MKKLIETIAVFGVLTLVLGQVGSLYAKEHKMELTTYYPAPSGDYRNLSLGTHATSSTIPGGHELRGDQ